MSDLAPRGTDLRRIALDAALVAAVVLTIASDHTVIFFHLVFVVLALEAFVRAYWGFVIRSAIGVFAVLVAVGDAVVAGTTQPEELLEIPLMTLIIATVFAIAGQRKRSEDRLAHLASHDALTGLADRTQLREWLAIAVTELQRRRVPFALLFLDLDDFRDVNDTFGRAVGDALIVEVARRLQRAVGTSDVVARMGGDDFAVLLRDVESAPRAEEIAARLVALMTQPIVVGDHLIRVGASVGVVVGDGSGLAETLRHADAAMREAKGAGKGRYRTAAAVAKSVR
ncbi:MAG TPA: GGDEF domain-containing protein [Candidatus Limnocylindria bacterium]|nr:GGDEF domain-containing protein [Candidatus Limnocylindria bacterium]